MKNGMRLGTIAGMLVGIAIVGNGGQISSSIAQEDLCYMRTSSGRVINLNGLCAGGTTTTKPAPAAAPGAANPAKSMFQAKIKYRMGKAPVIDVTFNRRHTFEMIVDTGADGTLITQQMAAALGVPIAGKGEFEMADGRVVQLPLGRLQSISVDGAEVRDVVVAIADQSQVGLLGHDFFDSFDIKIKQNVVEFYRR